MYKCKECGKNFEKVKSMCIHRQKQHNVLSENTYIDLVLNGEKPKCACGCSEIPKYLSGDKGFREYVLGHAARVNNNWGHNLKAIKKSHATQKKMYNEGKLIIWNKGLTVDDPRVKDNIDKVMANPERGNNISKKLTGKLKSEEHKQKLKESQIVSWLNPDKREKQSHTRIEYIIKNGFQTKSKLEETFKIILLNNFNFIEGIDYYHQFYVREIKSLFDFKISGKPIIIEIDGDFWHCNPNGKFPIATYAAQKKNLIQDKIKEKWCLDNNIKLLRFWESDINNTPEDIINVLIKELNL